MILEISAPSVDVSNEGIFSDSESTCSGETAIGNGSKFPLVISTSIKLKAFETPNI